CARGDDYDGYFDVW
nr:immunoglobulin heavy chain junction region [Mus musculus]